MLRPLDIHYGEYKRVVHRQRTGPFQVSWSSLSVQDKIAGLGEPARRPKLQRVFEFLMSKADSDYERLVLMQSCRLREPFAHKIFTAPEFQGVECTLWPTLYYMRSLCETMLTGPSNQASSKISFTHKVLLPLVDYSLDFDILQFNYDRWLFKTTSGAINSSRASGCSPNCGLQHKSFSATFWWWQHLLLVDTICQYGFPSFFITVSHYEWAFPWTGFIEEICQQHCQE